MPKHYYLTQYCPSYYSKGINKKHDKNHLHQIHAAHTSHRYRFRKPRKPLFLIVVLLMIMVIILVSWIYYFRYENSADKRIQAFLEAMRYKDKEQLTSLVTSNHQPLTDEEAVAYFALIQTMGGSDRYMKQIKSAIHQLDQNEATSKDINIDGVTILTINKKTQLYGYIKEFQFEIPQFRFILDAKDNGELTYQLNDKKA
ncbi:TcaA second domain-containing protein [Staphylococcus warneri]